MYDRTTEPEQYQAKARLGYARAWLGINTDITEHNFKILRLNFSDLKIFRQKKVFWVKFLAVSLWPIDGKRKPLTNGINERRMFKI